VHGLAQPVAVAVSADGRHVYATGRADNALAVFRRDPQTGSLTFVEFHRDGFNGVYGMFQPTAVTVTPDGLHVLVTSSGDDSLVLFQRNIGLGTLTFLRVYENNVGGIFGLQGASAVTVSPDGRHVLVTGKLDNSLVMFRRDITADELAFVEYQDLSTGAFGLRGASSVTVTPDGRHVLVTGEDDDALVVFRRIHWADWLDFFGIAQDGVLGVDGLAGASSVAVSPGGSNVYVAGRNDNAVAQFARSLTTGELTFITHIRDGVGDADGLAGAAAVAVNPAGNLVFVASELDNAVVAFDASADAGAMRFREVIVDDIGGVDGLAGAVSAGTSPDDLHLYVAGKDDNAVATLAILQVIFTDGFESGDPSAWTATFP
jgi:6-phosphogluconolactonase (cycloisomerase 2 family)